jgi:hypothetical protein
MRRRAGRDARAGVAAGAAGGPGSRASRRAKTRLIPLRSGRPPRRTDPPHMIETSPPSSKNSQKKPHRPAARPAFFFPNAFFPRPALLTFAPHHASVSPLFSLLSARALPLFLPRPAFLPPPSAARFPPPPWPTSRARVAVIVPPGHAVNVNPPWIHKAYKPTENRTATSDEQG